MPLGFASDLTDLSNVEDAEHELRRATGSEARAAWAEKWGEAAVAALKDLPAKSEESEWEMDL